MQFQRIMCIKGVGWWILTTRANSYYQSSKKPDMLGRTWVWSCQRGSWGYLILAGQIKERMAALVEAIRDELRECCTHAWSRCMVLRWDAAAGFHKGNRREKACPRRCTELPSIACTSSKGSCSKQAYAAWLKVKQDLCQYVIKVTACGDDSCNWAGHNYSCTQ